MEGNDAFSKISWISYVPIETIVGEEQKYILDRYPTPTQTHWRFYVSHQNEQFNT